MNNKALVQALYLNKLQTSILYEGAARHLKPFSEAMFNLFNAFGRQDAMHSIHLHGLMAKLEREKFPGRDIPIKVWVINGIGEREPRKNDEDSGESVSALISEWVNSLGECEKQCMVYIDAINQESPDIMGESAEYVNLSDLRVISEDRIDSLTGLKKISDRQLVFQRNFKTQWKCLYCGYVSEGEAAPEECHCCQSPISYMQKGNWKFD